MVLTTGSETILVRRSSGVQRRKEPPTEEVMRGPMRKFMDAL